MIGFLRQFTISTGLAVALLITSDVAQADLKSDLRSSFNSMSMSNTTNPGVYRGQTATMFTGGGLTYRTPVRNYQLASIQMPRARAGCGGIDVFAGGVSFIEADELKNMLKNIQSNLGAVAYKLAIDIISAQIGSSISEAMEWAQELNALQINSCEAATNLVGGAFDRVAGEHLSCIRARIQTRGEDWAKAKMACGAGGATDQSTDPATKNVLPVQGNLAWKAMVRNRLFVGNNDLRYLFMALAGTVIIDGDRIDMIPPGISTEEGNRIIETMIYGGENGTANTLTLHACVDDSENEDGCTIMTYKNISVGAGEGLFGQARSNIQSLMDHLRTDTPLTLAQEQFLTATRLPIFALLSAAYAAGGPGLAMQNLDEYAELLARDALYTYLDGLIAEVYRALDRISARTEASDSALLSMNTNIREARAHIASIQQQHLDKLDQQAQMFNRFQMHKRILISRMPGGTFVPAQLMGSGE